MITKMLADFYEQDLSRVKDEILQFRNEDNLWLTVGTAKNSAGNLVLHLVGGTSYLIGSLLAHTGYQRNREQEFLLKGIPRAALLQQLDSLIALVGNTLRAMPAETLGSPYPIPFDDKEVPVRYVLVKLLGHINYHLGQINYLRRMLE